MGGYSNFMNHKTWHPSSMQNQEKVWQAEQAVIRERKRLEAIQKELAKERDISAIRALQNEHGHTKKSQRIEWMYAGARGPSNEEYLLGKELKASLDEDIKAKSELTLKEVPGSTFVNKKTNSLLETEARMREDPLMAIQMEEQSQRHSILKNPVKMKKIKENADLLKKLKKAAKKKRKMERKEKKSGSKRRKEAVSDSDSDGARGRGRERSRSREQNRDRGRREGSRGDRSRNGGGDWGRDRGRRARSRSVSRERRSERGGRSERGRERRRSRSRSPERVKLEEPVPVKQEGRAKVAGGGLQGKYGLIMPAKAKASGLRKADAPADKPASGRVKKEPARRPAARRPAKMSTEERAARLAAMAADGAAHDRDARVRLVKANKAKKEEEDAYLGRNLDEEHQASFITKMNKDIYSGKESLEERMSKHKNSRQRGNMDRHSFLKR